MHTPSYVHLNGFGIYYFRMAIPRHLKAILGKHEIRRSLKTTNYTFAVKKARRLAVLAESLFLSDNFPGKKKFLQVLNQGFRLLAKESANINRALVIPKEHHATNLSSSEVNAVADLPPLAPIQLTSYQINLPPLAPQPQPVLPEPDAMLLSELIGKYVQCQMDENSWQPKTKEENIAIFDLLQRVVGDTHLSVLNHESVDCFRSILKKLPPHMNKSPLWKGLTIEEIIKAKPPETLSDSSINKYMRRIASMFNWAVDREYVGRNCFRKKPIKEAKKANEKRGMLTGDDLAALFLPARFEAEADQPFKYWTPLIALYTGARQNEIASMDGSDIKQIHGIWCFRFITAKQKEYTERFVPVHSRLRELGIIDYAKRQPSKLFPELDNGRDGYGQAVSKWYNRYRRKCGLNEIRNKDFHSFRHTLSTELYRVGVAPMLISEIDGHCTRNGTRRSTTEEVYIKPSEVVTIKDALEKLDYGQPLRSVRAFGELFP